MKYSSFEGGFDMAIFQKSTVVLGTLAYLLPEDGLGLTAETLLFSVVTPPTLGELGLLRLLVLSHLKLLMVVAGTAVSPARFWHIHLKIAIEVPSLIVR